MKTDEQLADELREATRGLLFMSESDYPFELVRWEGVDELTHDFLRGLTGQDSSTPVETRTAAEFFRAAADTPQWKSEAELATARRYQSLLRLLEENLPGLKVYRVGSVNMPVYVVGRGPSGGWLGVSTRVVET
jgi:hypothetical protein